MSAAHKYSNRAQQRILAALGVLSGHEISGIATGDLAARLRTSASNVTRDMHNLIQAGYVEQLDDGRWRLTPRFAQLSMRVLAALERAQQQLDEARQRYTRTL